MICSNAGFGGAEYEAERQMSFYVVLLPLPAFVLAFIWFIGGFAMRQRSK